MSEQPSVSVTQCRRDLYPESANRAYAIGYEAACSCGWSEVVETHERGIVVGSQHLADAHPVR